MKKGSGYFHFDGKVIEVWQGSVIAVPPGTLHGIETFAHPLECVVTIEGTHPQEIDSLYEQFAFTSTRGIDCASA